MDRLSNLKDKSEYRKIKEDYSNNFGFNTGLNSFQNRVKKDKIDNFVKGEINVKKR